MILPDFQIALWAQYYVKPYDQSCINPASLDLRLGSRMIDLNQHEPLPPDQRDGTEFYTLRPGYPVLATTLEYVKLPPTLAGLVCLKSSLARQGLDHALAGWVDPGFEGELTLELHAHAPVTIFPGQRIVQIVLYAMAAEPVTPYRGRYLGQRGPTPARSENE